MFLYISICRHTGVSQDNFLLGDDSETFSEEELK